MIKQMDRLGFEQTRNNYFSLKPLSTFFFNHHCFKFVPVLRLKFTLVAMKLRRNATFLLLVSTPTVFGLIELSALSTFVKAYLRLFV